MSGHTPGPWVAATSQWGDVSVKSANDSDLAEWPVEYFIAEKIGGHVLGEDFTDFSEVHANANLIAAAPDLLEALETITSLYADEMYSERSCKEDDLPEVMAARKAIARAKGEK